MKSLLKEKILLEEPEDEVLPDVVPEEPIEISTEVLPEEQPEIMENAISSLITGELTSVYSNIDTLKSIIATIALEAPERQDLIDIFNELVNERTIHVGMLQQALELVDGEHKSLVDTGAEEASAIASEPANELEDK